VDVGVDMGVDVGVVEKLDCSSKGFVSVLEAAMLGFEAAILGLKFACVGGISRVEFHLSGRVIIAVSAILEYWKFKLRISAIN
jgi:hypothetical protein